MIERGAKVFVAGHRGLVGSAIERRMRAQGFERLLLRERSELDLTKQPQVDEFFERERPEYVVLAAARVGGILANDTYPADFLRENLLIQTLVFDAAHRCGVRKLVFLGSSCIYPREAPQPIAEESLLTGALEPTNAAYAIAKIAGVEAVRSYARQFGFKAIALMPTNLYGPGDNFDLETSHVVPALMRKMHDAKLAGSDHVSIWGSGEPLREFLHVDDLASACLFLLENYDDPEPINVGTGVDLSIRELAQTLRDVVGFTGDLRFDPAKPDGTPRKVLDVSKLQALGWRAQIGLRDGLQSTYAWYVEQRGR